MRIKPHFDQKMAGFWTTLTDKACNELSWPLDGIMPSQKKGEKSLPNQLKNSLKKIVLKVKSKLGRHIIFYKIHGNITVMYCIC